MDETKLAATTAKTPHSRPLLCNTSPPCRTTIVSQIAKPANVRPKIKTCLLKTKTSPGAVKGKKNKGTRKISNKSNPRTVFRAKTKGFSSNSPVSADPGTSLYSSDNEFSVVKAGSLKFTYLYFPKTSSFFLNGFHIFLQFGYL